MDVADVVAVEASVAGVEVGVEVGVARERGEERARAVVAAGPTTSTPS